MNGICSSIGKAFGVVLRTKIGITSLGPLRLAPLLPKIQPNAKHILGPSKNKNVSQISNKSKTRSRAIRESPRNKSQRVSIPSQGFCKVLDKVFIYGIYRKTFGKDFCQGENKSQAEGLLLLVKASTANLSLPKLTVRRFWYGPH